MPVQPVPSGAAPPQLPPPPPTGPEPNYPSRMTLARWLLVGVAVYVVLWLLWASWPAMTPFILGLVLAYLLTPVVKWLSRYIPRAIAIVLVILAGIGVLAGVIAFVVPLVIDQLVQLYKNIPTLPELQRYFDNVFAWYQANVPGALRDPLDNAMTAFIARVQANISTYIQTVGTFLLDQVVQLVSLVSFLVGFVVIPFWLFYVMNSEGEGVSFINKVLPDRVRKDFWNLWRIIDRDFSSYIRGQLILGLAVGTLVGIGLTILRLIGFDVRYILLLAIIAGITELIPYIGPILGAIPAIILALFANTDPVQTTIAVIVVYVIVQQLENNLLVPRIVGESVGINPAVLTVLLIALGYVYGLLGVILAPPLSASARDVFLYLYHRLRGEAPDEVLERVLTSAHKLPPEKAKEATDAAEDKASTAP